MSDAPAAWDRARLRAAMRLYAVTPTALGDADAYGAAVAAAIRGGATAVQYRDKGATPDDARARAAAIVAACRGAGVLCIVNDDAALAANVGADGVHLGPDDGDVAAVRARFPALVVGGSAGTVERAQALVEAGADYLGVGAIFDARASKANASAPRGVGALRELRGVPSLADVPVVAIGGITNDNARACVEAGADGVAVIRAVFGAPDVEAAARACADALRGA